MTIHITITNFYHPFLEYAKHSFRALLLSWSVDNCLKGDATEERESFSAGAEKKEKEVIRVFRKPV